MGMIFALVNNKGGVGKTTTTSVMTELLAEFGKKVLLVDNDGQGNLSMLYGCKDVDSRKVIQGLENAEKPNIHEVYKYSLRTKEDIKRVIRKTPVENIDIIPASKRHKETTKLIQMMKLNSVGNPSIILKKAIEAVKDDYDYIFIDNGPAIDDLTVNTIFASDYMLVPVRSEIFSYEGLIEILDEVNYIKEEHFIENCEFLGTFMTQVKARTNIFKDLSENYKDELAEKFLQTPIRDDIKISKMETELTTLLKLSPNSNALFDYAKLILEINTKINFIDSETEKILKSITMEEE
ncbi:MAG: ParA family protein [Candidatus Galacturonibacter soehngenii]|nr:ParA family protein [Candidatus Galacturonibacter soehngenii]